MKRLVVGIAGGTGSGKTTIAETILEAVEAGQCVMIQCDNYYKDLSHLSMEERDQCNFDHPASLDLDLLAEHLQQLKEGHAIQQPIYNFADHTRLKETLTINPARIVLFEGILIFFDKRLRDTCDIRLFVDTDADIRLMRRIRRDMEKRGRTFQSIRQQYYDTVRPMHLEFVEPTKRWADLIIPEGGSNKIAIDIIVQRLKAEIQSA